MSVERAMWGWPGGGIESWNCTVEIWMYPTELFPHHPLPELRPEYPV